MAGTAIFHRTGTLLGPKHVCAPPRVDPNGVAATGLVRQHNHLALGAGAGVHFHALSQQLILSDGRHRVRGHVSLIGFEVLGQALREQLAPTGEDFALPWYRLRAGKFRKTVRTANGAEPVAESALIWLPVWQNESFGVANSNTSCRDFSSRNLVG